MKKIITSALVFVFYTNSNLHAQSVAINNDGSNADASAALDIKSTSKGMLVPRMTTVQRTAIASPANGLLVFDETTSSYWFKETSGWTELVDKSNEKWQFAPNGIDVYRPNFSRVGINRNIPNYPLDVDGSSSDNGVVARFNNPTSAVGEYSSILLHTGTQNGNQGSAAISSISSVSGGQHLAFTTVASGSNTASSVFEKMRIDSAGNVGIGTKVPDEKLDVNGNIKLSGAVMKPGFGNLNFVPYAYGRVSAGGVVYGTQNFTLTHPGTGNYWINFGSAAGLNTSNSLIVITPEGTQSDNISVGYDQTFNPNIFIVSINRSTLNKVQCNQGNVACPSVIFDASVSVDPINKGFSFVVYKFQF